MRHLQKDVSSDLFGKQKHVLLFARVAKLTLAGKC